MLRPYGLESATTNQSEIINYALKRLQEWKEAPVDAMALSLFRLSQYHLVEIKRGLCGQGEYHLRVGIEASVTNVLPPVVRHPNDIVDSIRQGSASANGTSSDNDVGSDTSDAVHMPSTSTSSSSTATSATAPASDLPDVEPDDGVNSQDPAALTADECAAVVISTSKIALDPKLAIFTVCGTSEPRVVRLFPTATCSCPAKTNCYHVLAAKMAVGITSNTQKRTLSLTQLRKNIRKCPDKTSDRRRPRLDDVNVVAADDHDSEQTAQLHAAINVVTESAADDGTEPPTTSSSSSTTVSVRPDICHACEAAQPPAGKWRRRRVINCVCCDQCDRWYHMVCVHLATVPDQYVCSQCG